jgi:hypothetical protein
MYAGTKEEYMRIPANNLQGDKTPVHKFARHSVFAVITAWSSWQDNPRSKAGMKKDAQDAGFLQEYLKTLAAWAHSCQQWVRKNRKKADPPKMPWLLSPAPEEYFKPGEYAQLAAVEINGAEKGQPEAKYKAMLFPLAHAQSGKSPFAPTVPEWSQRTAAQGANLKAKVTRVSRVLKTADHMLFHD